MARAVRRRRQLAPVLALAVCGAIGQAKDTWASHDVPHHAAYAGWRLAVCLLDRGRRNDGQNELNYCVRGGAAPRTAATGDRGPADARVCHSRPPHRRPTRPPRAAATSGAAGSGLTPRELDVLRLLGTGASNDEIGHRLYISPKTASVHVTHIFRKLGVNGRVQAAMVAERMGPLTTGTNEGGAP